MTTTTRDINWTEDFFTVKISFSNWTRGWNTLYPTAHQKKLISSRTEQHKEPLEPSGGLNRGVKVGGVRGKTGCGVTVSNDHFCDYATGFISLAATSQKWHWQLRVSELKDRREGKEGRKEAKEAGAESMTKEVKKENNKNMTTWAQSKKRIKTKSFLTSDLTFRS